jgi:hypothetical protein
MNFKILAYTAISAISLSACDTYTGAQYQSNPQNTIALQELTARGESASVGEVSLAEGVEARPVCRLAGPLDLGGGDSLAMTIKHAVQAELLAGGVYKTGGTPININVTALQPDSIKGEWTIGLQVYSSRSAGFAVRSVTDFSTSFTAVSACNNTATAFNRALADTINSMVTDPRFAQMI